VLIGPGTGVCPFRAFLLERAWQWRRAAHSAAEPTPTPQRFGQVWLYTGCRAPDLDFLYRDDLLALVGDADTGNSLRNGTAGGTADGKAGRASSLALHGRADQGALTHLRAAFSRVGDGKVYVQHLIREVEPPATPTPTTLPTPPA